MMLNVSILTQCVLFEVASDSDRDCENSHWYEL